MGWFLFERGRRATVLLGISTALTPPIPYGCQIHIQDCTLMQKTHGTSAGLCGNWCVGCVCVHEHMPAEGGDAESRTDLQMSVWVWMATLTHAYVDTVLRSSLCSVHFAVQHLYFSATWFQTWKSCIWCWKLSSHQTAYFKTQHLMPEVWKKSFSSSTCIPKAGKVFLNLPGSIKPGQKMRVLWG